jgi:hypothetical protein
MENRSEVMCGRFARCQEEKKIVRMGETAVKNDINNLCLINEAGE